ncbi:MAG TPA: antitoxin [Acidimicrobiales bacterium]
MAGFLDKAKDLARDLTGKAKSTVTENADKIEEGIGKAADFVDDKTKRKYSDKIGKAQDAARKAVDKLAEDGGGGEERRSDPGPS